MTTTSATIVTGATAPAAGLWRPAKHVVEPEPSFVPALGGSRPLVLLSNSVYISVDADTGAVREIALAPVPVASTYYGLSRLSFVPSPDGARYAFACDDNGQRPDVGYGNNLCMRRAGSEATEIVARGGPDEAFGAYPPSTIEWSPDGSRIAFRKRNRDNAAVTDVYVVDLTTQATTRVITNAGHEPWGPVTWSPDGMAFLIQRLWPSSSDLRLVDASTGEMTDLTRGLFPPRQIVSFSWSPDGQTVAFIGVEGMRSTTEDMFVVSVAGGSVRKVMGGLGGNGRPAWSPDGKWIAATADVRDAGAQYATYRVYVVRADGEEERALPDELATSSGPVWAPDSSHLAVRGTVGGSGGIVVTSVRGATPVIVGQQSGAPYPDFMMWSADGKRIVFIDGGICGQGGCASGLLYTVDVDGNAPPRKLFEQPIDAIVSP